MPRIHRLDPQVVNQIAAGEVIERPASVVKELLENSLDALAGRIDVDITDGGAELIRVADDGEGLHQDDFELAVTSHATSKLEAADDLFHVHTLGFRGEALASIASVSRLRLRSRQAAAETGCQLEVDAGRLGPLEPCGCPAGTLIEVRQLFGNTPVRRKFLRSAGTEFGHVSEQFTRIALAHPRLQLTLRHNDRAVYDLPPTERLIERLALFYGRELAEQLIAVDGNAGLVRLWGYVAHPSQSKSTRKAQYLFLNGRSIQDRSLQHALAEAYRGLLMVGRHPIAFLFLEVPADQVDVNVHPTKAEVRFRDAQQLYRLLLSTLRTKFLGMNLDARLQLPGSAASAGSTLDFQPLRESAHREPHPPVDPARQQQLRSEFVDWARQALAEWTPDRPAVIEPLLDAQAERWKDEPEDAAAIGLGGTNDSRQTLNMRMEDGGWRMADDIHDPASSLQPPSQAEIDPAPEPDALAAPASSGVRRVMQVLDTYLVAETEDGLAVIDQHALHERVMYEHLRKRVLAGTVESQKLLVPEAVELPAREAALLLEHRALLAELGFDVDEFGKGTVLVTAYPVMLGRADRAAILRDLADRLDDAGQAPTRRELIDSLLNMMACKAAIKAGHRLSPEEMETLLAQRHLIDDAHHCPHGRPTALVLTRGELEKQFGRLG